MKDIINKIEEKMKERDYWLYATSNEGKVLHFGTPPTEKPNFSCEIYVGENENVTFKFRYITKKLSILTTGEIGSFFDDNQFNKFEVDFWNLASVLYDYENKSGG